MLTVESAGAHETNVAALAARFAYLFVCSTALGLLVGLAAAATARLVSHRGGAGGDGTVALEVAVVGVLAYISFLLAEAVRCVFVLLPRRRRAELPPMSRCRARRCT